MLLVSSCSCLYPIHWNQVLNWEWRCSWSSADRRCSNYIWVINNLIAYWSATYIRGLTVVFNDSWFVSLTHGKTSFIVGFSSVYTYAFTFISQYDNTLFFIYLIFTSPIVYFLPSTPVLSFFYRQSLYDMETRSHYWSSVWGIRGHERIIIAKG